MSPLFSIIIPVYNVAPYLRKCLDSVLSQTCGAFECICVDDGSTDGGGAILDEYAVRDARIRVVHQSNAGVSAARNVALDIATGEWVQFLDGDDSLEPDFLANLSSAIKGGVDVDAVEHTAIYCYADGTCVYGDKGRLPPRCVVPASEILKDPWGRKYTSLGRCSCYKIFRRAVIEESHLRFVVGIPLGEDSLFSAQFYAFARNVDIRPEIAGYLRIFRDDSAMHTISFDRLMPKIKALEVLYSTWKRHKAKGFDVCVAASVLSTCFLGKEYGADIRRNCINELLRSSFFNRRAIPFLLLHGTWKSRLFAIAYLVSSIFARRKLLEWL